MVADEKLHEGDVEFGQVVSLDVVRGGDYLGQVRVDDVQEKYCTAIIVLAKAPMQARDMATTRL